MKQQYLLKWIVSLPLHFLFPFLAWDFMLSYTVCLEARLKKPSPSLSDLEALLGLQVCFQLFVVCEDSHGNHLKTVRG